MESAGVRVYVPNRINSSQTDENEDIWDQIAGYDEIKQVCSGEEWITNRILKIQLFYRSNIQKNIVKLQEKQGKSTHYKLTTSIL